MVLVVPIPKPGRDAVIDPQKRRGLVVPIPRAGDNPVAQKIVPVKSWEDMSFGEKLFATVKEIPGILKAFVPEAIQERTKELAEMPFRERIAPKEYVKTAGAAVKGIGEFGVGVARVTAEAISGVALGAKELITQKPETISIPILGELGSFQEQHRQLTEQGFSDEEAKALVGINTYLGLMPLAAKGLKTPLAKRGLAKVTTEKVSAAVTKEGLIAEATGKKIPVGEVVRERSVITKAKEKLGQAPEQQQFHEQLTQHLDDFFEGRDKILGREDPLNKALLKLDDTELKTYSSYTQGLVSVEKPSPNLKVAIDVWKETNKKIEQDLIKAGKLTPEQVENRRWIPVERTTGVSRVELKKMGVEPIYYPYLAEDLLKKSDFIAATGKRTKAGFLKRFTGKLLAQDNYIKNPLVAIPRHRIQVFRQAMNEKLVNDVRDTFAVTDKRLISKLKTDPSLAEKLGLAEWKPSGSLRFFPAKTETGKLIAVTKRVESHWIPKTIASELDRFSKPGTIERTLRLTYDPAIDLWRISVLSLMPRWLYNNFVGNTMLATLARTDPLAFLKAGKALITKREFPKGVLMKEYAGGEAPRIGKLGSLPREVTQFRRPIENWLNLLEQSKQYRVLRPVAVATQAILNGYIALGKPIGFLNKVTENWFRAAVYISKTEGKFLGFQLEKPVPPLEGIRYVNEFLFDYSKLSRAERATFRRALPFWNWQKNIVNFSFKFPARHPMRGLIVGALLQDYVDWINEQNQKEDKTKSILRIKTDMTYEGKPLYLNVKSAIPFSDVFRTVPKDFETIGRFMTSNPVSKIIIERAFRINSFTGQPFTQPKELQRFDEFGKPILPLPSVLRHLGQQVPQVKIAQQIMDFVRYGKPLRRFETGEPKVYQGKIKTEDLVIDLLKYFGISYSAIDFEDIQRGVERKTMKQEFLEKRFMGDIERGLRRLQEAR